MTPMQELIEVLKIHRDTAFEKSRMYESEHYHSRGQAFNDAISFAELQLEKEKEVMCEFADKYRDDSCYATIQGGVSSEETTEEFFDKTFDTKEK